MKLKKIFTSVIAGAALLAFAGAASAVTTYRTGTTTPTMPTSDINVYGASAQFTFWKTEAPIYLQNAGCTLTNSGATSDGKHFIQEANCGGTTVNFRVSSKASYDGPLAVDGNSTHPSRDTACSAVGANYRPMISMSDCSGGTCSAPAAPGDCYAVTIGASDVAVSDFVQYSQGLLKGPLGGSMTTRNFGLNPFTMSPNTTSYCQPQAIPFSFFVHDDVISTATGTVITNITTAEAKMIFSGTIKDWSELQNQAVNAKPVAVCLRHAGSGTHASMDGFMRPQSMLKVAVPSGSYRVYFNDGSSDLMKCVNGSGTWSGAGAIGYADSDQDLNPTTSNPSGYVKTRRITIDGVQPSTANVDDYSHAFTSIQQLYANTTTAATNVMQDLCTFASQPSTITSVNPNWSASCNMKHVKDSVFGNWRNNTNYHNANCN